MKRLQFRNHKDVFETRSAAVQYFKDIVDAEKVLGEKFGESLYAEPLVARYKDEDENVRILLAIGTGNEHSPYQIIEANTTKIEKVTDGIASDVRDEYVLKTVDGTELGEHIKVYKDSSLVAVKFGHEKANGASFDEASNEYVLTYPEGEHDDNHEYLYLIYKEADGSLKLFGVDFEEFLQENEFGEGLSVLDHKVSLKIKADDKFIEIGENGLQTKGIDEAIESSIDDLKIVSMEPTSSRYKAIYELRKGERPMGEQIKIDKESSLVSVTIGHIDDTIDSETGAVTAGTGDGALVFIYRTEDGKYEIVKIKVSDYFTDAHFGMGLQNHDGVISIAKGEGSEDFLAIGEDSISIVGVNDAIKAADDKVLETVNAEFEKVRGDETVDGSIKHIVNDKINATIIAGGLPTSPEAITIEEARQQSLLRAIKIDGSNMAYYASSNAADMFYQKPNGDIVKLSDYITSLENEIAELNSTLDERVKTIIKNYVVGTQNEISVGESADKFKIAFDNDAIFGEA